MYINTQIFNVTDLVAVILIVEIMKELYVILNYGLYMSRIYTQTSGHGDWYDNNKFRFLRNWGKTSTPHKFTSFKLEFMYG